MKNTSPVPRRAFFRVIWQLIRIAPIPLGITLLLRLINAVSRVFQPILIAGFTNALINAEDLFIWCSIYLSFITLELLTDAFKATTQMWFSNKAILHFQQHMLRQATQTPLHHFLDPNFHDNLTRATHRFGDRVVSWFRSLIDNIHSVVTCCGLFATVLILGGGLWCLLILFFSSLIILYTRYPIANIELDRDRAAARPDREQAEWASHLYKRECAPEVRLFILQQWILSKWEKAYRCLADVDMEALKSKTRWNALATLSSVVGYGGIVYIAAHTAHAANEKEIAGVFTGLMTSAVTLQGGLSYMAHTFGSLSEHSGVLNDLASWFTTAPPKAEEHQDSTLPDPGIQVEMNAISFQYPRATTQTLKDITAKIGHGEIVALVGKNGSGKTTLGYLLLGLYAPDSGTLKFSENGQPSGTPARSAVFQDFIKFLQPVRDNVGFADQKRLQDNRHLQHTLQRAGSTFAQKLDTWLGHEFGGRDISGGEWLRIAVARGLFRTSNFVVFDEPTASIDPVAEIEMIQELLTKDDSRAVLVISHRLGVARLCDRILVLDEGQLLENGTHDQLLAQNGIYAQMWNAQASWYT